MAYSYMNVSIKKNGTDPALFIKTAQAVFGNASTVRIMNRIKKEVLQDVNRYIKEHRKRTQETHDEDWRVSAKNNLYYAIEAGTYIENTTPGKYRLCIGDKTILNTATGGNEKNGNKGYWDVVNNGGRPRVPTREVTIGKGANARIITVTGFFGHFAGAGRWFPAKGITNQQTFKIYRGGDKFTGLMNPVNPIPPMYYINRMVYMFTNLVEMEERNYKEALINKRLYTTEQVLMQAALRRKEQEKFNATDIAGGMNTMHDKYNQLLDGLI